MTTLIHHLAVDWIALSIPLSVGTAVATVVSLAVQHLQGTPQPQPLPLADRVQLTLDQSESQDVERLIHWLPGESLAGDRRRSTRRRGRLTAVELTADPGSKVMAGGLVADRSTGGLCIASDQAWTVGGEVYVRAEEAPSGSPWVATTVRNCRRQSDFFLIGCEFRQTPPWGTLLLFG